MNRTVAIVGRPNVGKSTFFNRLIGERKSIIDDISGVTRDRIYGEVEWNGTHFDLIDTGGYINSSDDVFEKAIKEQVKIAIDESRIILFVVDVTTGITSLDEDVADLLRKCNKDVLLIVNKVDNNKRLQETAEFYGLGFSEMFNLSSISGSGTGEILDRVVEMLPKEEIEEIDEYADTEEDETKIAPRVTPQIAIVGQPNVGKSSLINALIGEERNIVTEVAGTTRDSIHTKYSKYGKDFVLIDTAGIRRKTKVHENLEFYSVIRSIKSIEDSNIVLLMIDAKAGMEAQDMSLFKIIQRRKKAVVLVVNKWDTVEKETNTMKDYEAILKKKLAPFDDIPIVFTSVTEKQRIFKLLELVEKVSESQHRRISTRKLNDVLLKIIDSTPIPSYRGTLIKIKYITQLHAYTPTFAFFCNYPKHIPDNYKNFLKNKLRENFDFEGVNINLLFKEK
jgi:GTP-binding protein